MKTDAAQAPSEIIRKLLSGADELPVLPDAAARILQEMRSPDVNARRVADLASNDPVLTSAILRLANSALYGGRAEITDLSYAIVRVGLHQSRNLVLALVLRSLMADPNVYGRLGPQLMDHALAVALGSRVVAEVAGIENNQAFLCGLLHDFGRLALIKALRESAGLRREDLPPEMMSLVDQHHPEAGAMLAAHWRLPDVVALVARRHHQPELAGEQQPMVAVVAFANAVAHHMGVGEPPVTAEELARHPSVGLLQLRPEQTEAICKHVDELFAAARTAVTV